MRWEIQLNNARFYAFIGVYPEEQIAGNWFEVNINVSATDIKEVPTCITETLDYSLLYQVAKEEMTQKDTLIETVAGRIGQRLLNQAKGVETVEVSITKLAPALGGPLSATSVKAIFSVSSPR